MTNLEWFFIIFNWFVVGRWVSYKYKDFNTPDFDADERGILRFITTLGGFLSLFISFINIFVISSWVKKE
jgi:hypothetical protein